MKDKTPPEGSLVKLPLKPCIIGRSLLTATNQVARMVPLRVTWTPKSACLMPVLLMHIVVPGMPVHGAN